MTLLKPREAAELLGISYPTLKQWIYQGKIGSVKTAGGHHRIPREEVDRLRSPGTVAAAAEVGTLELNSISARNKLRGIIRKVRFEGMFAQITLDLGGQELTSIIPSEACRELKLKRGEAAVALVKALDVIIVSG